MKPTLSKKSLSLLKEPSAVKQIMSYASSAYLKKLGWEQSQVISFAGGWVNHESPELLRKSYLDVANNSSSFHKSGSYSPTLGMEECKEAIIKYENHLYNVNNLNSKQIAIGSSSTQLTINLLQLLLDEGDKVLLLDPFYCNFPLQIKELSEVKTITFPVVDVEKWEYIADKKIDEIKLFIEKEKPKVIIFTSPDNPTSQIPSDKFVKSVLESITKVGGFLVIDFAYKDITFIEKLPEYFSWEPSQNFISIHSNSKWYRGLGRRMGWIEAEEEIIDRLASLQASSILAPDTLHQMAFTQYINESIENNSLKPYVESVREMYKKAATKTVDAIRNKLGFPCFTPEGGIYTCMKLSTSGESFVEEAARKIGVLFVPGWGFGETQKNAVRVSYGPLVNNPELIEKGMQRLKDLLEKK